MKKKLKSFIIFLIVIAVIIGALYFTGTLYSIKETIFNTVENSLNRSGLEIVKGEGSLIDEEDLDSLKDSKITGEDYSFGEEYLYFNILKDKEKKIYKQVYANIVEVEKNFKPVANVQSDEIYDAIEAVFDDHPELFWVNTSYSYKYLDSGKVVQISLSYNSTSDDLDNNKKLFDKEVNIIVKKANKYKSDYEKEKFVHDYLIENNDYDKKEKLNQSSYSAIIIGKTVCAGYSRAFQHIMNKIGIKTYYIGGDAKGDHAWNIVLLDGDYYNVDITFDDDEDISYEYFNVPDSVFSKTHIRKGLSIYLPVCRGTKYYEYEKNKKTDKDEEDKVQEKVKVEETDEVMMNENEITNEDIEEQLDKEDNIFNN